MDDGKVKYHEERRHHIAMYKVSDGVKILWKNSLYIKKFAWNKNMNVIQTHQLLLNTDEFDEYRILSEDGEHESLLD